MSSFLFEEYIKKIKSGYFKSAIKVEWLNPDESVNFEFTNSLYGIDAKVDVNKQQGSRRTCTIVLNNDNNKFPIDFNSIWIGQKFKLWMGIYIDDETPCYFPQGVFYVSNPNKVYNPTTKTVTLNGVDKWAWLDGSLNGILSGTYKTNVNVNLFDATKSLLKTSMESNVVITDKNLHDYFDVSREYGELTYSQGSTYFTIPQNKSTKLSLIAKQRCDISLYYLYAVSWANSYFLDIKIKNNYILQVEGGVIASVKRHSETLNVGDVIEINAHVEVSGNYIGIHIENFIDNPKDPIEPFLSPYFLTKTTEVNGVQKSVLDCPYTATVERGNTYADILLEYATILCANIYYDVNGRLTLEPMIDTADDITDTNKEILWDFTVDEKIFLGITQKFQFDKIYNDFIVLGNIVNGYQFKGRVQNRNPLSNTCIQKIGLKTKEPYEDNQYTSNEQCIELAKYYAKTDTILQKSGDIPSITLYHLDVDKLITVSTPNNNMSKELFLITGFSLSASGQMTINVSSVNILKDFSVVEVE